MGRFVAKTVGGSVASPDNDGRRLSIGKTTAGNAAFPWDADVFPVRPSARLIEVVARAVLGDPIRYVHEGDGDGAVPYDDNSGAIALGPTIGTVVIRLRLYGKGRSAGNIHGLSPPDASIHVPGRRRFREFEAWQLKCMVALAENERGLIEHPLL